MSDTNPGPMFKFLASVRRPAPKTGQVTFNGIPLDEFEIDAHGDVISKPLQPIKPR